MIYTTTEKINDVSQWIEYNNEKILFHDFLNRQADEANEYIKKVTEIYKQIPSGSKVRILYNATGVQINKEAAANLNENTKSCNHIQIVTAVYGLTKLQTIIAKVANPKIHSGNSQEECLEWLINQKFE